MSQHPDMPPAQARGPGSSPSPAPPPPHMHDEVAAAKARLLAGTASDVADPTAKVNDFLHSHPYIAAGAAIGAGLLVARVQTLRKLATVGGIWAGKQMLYRQLRRMGR